MLAVAGGVRGVLDQGDDPAGHEARGPDRGAGPGHLADLDDAAAVGDVHAAARPGRRHLVGLDTVTGIDHGLDAIPLHWRPPRVAIPWAGAGNRGRLVLINPRAAGLGQYDGSEGS